VPVTAHPIFVTPDVERLRAFYGSLLGAEVTERFPEDGDVFYLGLRADAFTFGLTADGGVPVGEPGRVLLSIDVDDVDVLLPRVAELGGRVTGGPTDMPWGQRVLHVQDPDGNAVNLSSPI
jgi:predicted enzyme related to lactoylglutathione lyase